MSNLCNDKMLLFKPYTCTMCDVYLHCFDRMKQHVKRHKLKYTVSLKRHINTHTKKIPAYQCEYCQTYFSRQYHLTAHIRTHTKEKSYQCEYCQKCFLYRYLLTKHIKTHTKEKPYQCEYCEKCFSQRPHLNSHIRTHTKEKPYQCQYCQIYVFHSDLTWTIT